MKSVKVILCIASLAFVAIIATPMAEAQCVPSRNFASAINGTAKQGFGQVVVDSSVGTPLGDEIGRFWQSNNANLANNFGGGCPAVQWWKASAAPLGNAISGTIGGVGCAANACPDLTQDLTAVVEDWGTPAPGIGGTAYFVAWRVSPTPALLRAWNYARTASTPGTGNTTYPFLEFPQAFVTSSTRVGMDVNVTMNYADVSPNFHGATGGDPLSAGAIGTPTPATDAIVSYDLMLAVNLTDPGRARSSWTLLDTIPFPGMGVPGQFQGVTCPDTLNDAWLAVGISFDGGAAGPIPSTLVGRATQIECNPNMADPQQQQRLQQKPETRRPAGRR